MQINYHYLHQHINIHASTTCPIQKRLLYIQPRWKQLIENQKGTFKLLSCVIDMVEKQKNRLAWSLEQNQSPFPTQSSFHHLSDFATLTTSVSICKTKILPKKEWEMAIHKSETPHSNCPQTIQSINVLFGSYMVFEYWNSVMHFLRYSRTKLKAWKY